MGRPVKPDDKRRQLTQDALRQFRATRALIAPEVLEAARQVIAAQAARQKAPAKPAVADHVVIDRRRNMTVIMKFLELKSGDKHLQRQISDLFPEA